MTQNESCDIGHLHIVQLAVDSEQKLYYFCFDSNPDNRGVSHYRILPISRDIGWPVQQLDYFRYKATYTDC